MSIPENLPGISAFSLYVPSPRVRLDQWCEWTGANWGKVSSVVGESFRVPAPYENVYTMAANAVLRLILDNDVDPQRVGFLGLGTESSTDNAAGAVIVRGMVDQALDKLGKPRLARSVEVPEFKHACLGGVYALKAALRFVHFDGADKLAIVVAADIAEYERGSSGEQTQGAGAVAMLVEADPKMLAIDLQHGGSASDYRGPDFRKPVARHMLEDYGSSIQKICDFPVFSGRYSTFAYLDETAMAVEEMVSRLGMAEGGFFEEFQALFFHRPYEHMPVKTVAFLQVRALARTQPDVLAPLCEAAGVTLEAVVAEAASTPDLYAGVLDGNANRDPYPATGAVAGKLRKTPAFREMRARLMGLGSARAKQLGNLYSAALPAWVAAGLEQAAADGLSLDGARIALVGYGSGDAAEALPAYVVPGWEEAARRIDIEGVLANARDLHREQYEALHDGRDLPEELEPRNEFAILRVGDVYEPNFQDLCVEYYGFVGA